MDEYLYLVRRLIGLIYIYQVMVQHYIRTIYVRYVCIYDEDDDR